MMWRDEKYLRLLSPQLERFHQKQAHTFQFRCPLCGDSERNRSKARGYTFPHGSILLYKCHNCGISLPFAALLRRMSRHLYDQYLLEGLREQRAPEVSPEPIADTPRDDLSPGELPTLERCATRQNPLYPVYQFIHNRQIPDAALHRLNATESAQTWILPLVGEDKAEALTDGLEYLVIPLRLPSGDWYGCQMRLLTRKEYLTFRWSHHPLKVFGLEAWEPLRTTYVMEGPLDTLFIDNAIAGCGSDLLGTTRVMQEQGHADVDVPFVYVWDNEPRNREVVNHLETAIAMKQPVVIWPRSFPKDVNDAIQAGYAVQDVQHILETRTFVGLRAELEFQQWKK